MYIECLGKQKASNTVYYNQKEVFCDICQRNVKQCRLSKHLKTDRQAYQQGKTQKGRREKQKEMEEYLKDDETRIAKLKQIWKNIAPKNVKNVYPQKFSYHNLFKTMIRT